MTLPSPRILWMGIRPKTLSMSIMPVLVAFALSHAQGDTDTLFTFLIICLGAISIQIVTNLHNDAQDFINGTDTAQRVGPKRITHAGLSTPAQTKNAAYLFGLIASLCGLFLCYIGGWPILLIGTASLLAAFGYSAGPYPISRSPFGEIFVLIFFGILAVTGSYYLLSDSWSTEAILLGVIVGSPACAVLLLNNLRDLENDTAAGRRTLAICLGAQKAKILYIILLFLPYSLLLAYFDLTLSNSFAYGGVLLALLAVIKFNKAKTSQDLNPCLGISAASQTLLSIGLSLSLILS